MDGEAGLRPASECGKNFYFLKNIFRFFKNLQDKIIMTNKGTDAKEWIKITEIIPKLLEEGEYVTFTNYFHIYKLKNIARNNSVIPVFKHTKAGHPVTLEVLQHILDSTNAENKDAVNNLFRRTIVENDPDLKKNKIT